MTKDDKVYPGTSRSNIDTGQRLSDDADTTISQGQSKLVNLHCMEQLLSLEVSLWKSCDTGTS